MADASGIPRRVTVMTAAQSVKDLTRTVEQQGSARRLESASIGKGGLTVRNGGSITVSDGGAFVVQDGDGQTVARYGPLEETAPGSYGLEVLVGETWVHIGAQVATWDNLAGKPATFPAGTHNHSGTDITSPVAEAGRASEAGHAADADGSARAYNSEPAGSGSYYAVWVDANWKLCRNTSSIRYKENVRPHPIRPADVLALEPVQYDRKNGNPNEYGLIAEQVAEYVPELVQYFDGEVDGVRYDLLAVALLDVVKSQEARIAHLESRFR